MTITPSEFDSRIFGMKIGWASAYPTDLAGYDIVFLRGPYPCVLHPLTKLVDVRYDMVTAAAPPRDRSDMVLLRAIDASFSMDLAACAFAQHSRYFNDSQLCSRAAGVYRDWVANAHLRGDLYTCGGMGFLALSRTETELRIDLIAVSSDHRGKGVGQTMLKAFLRLPGPLLRKVKVEAGNLQAIHSYQQVGFRLDLAESVQHLHAAEE